MAQTMYYFTEYMFGDTLPSEASIFIHLRLDLPTYLDRIAKEEYFTSVTLGDAADEIVPSNGGTTTQTFTLDFTTVYPGSLNGSIYKQLGGSPTPGSDTQIQTFTTDWTGELSFTDVGSPSPKVSSGELNLITSIVTLTFNGTPAFSYYLEATYNYAVGAGGVDAFVSGLFDIPGVVELSVKANRVWLMKSPMYEWDEVLTNVLEFLRVYLGQDTITELDNSGNVVVEDQRRLL